MGDPKPGNSGNTPRSAGKERMGDPKACNSGNTPKPVAKNQTNSTRSKGLSQIAVKDRDGDRCKICSEKVERKDRGINCDACEKWYHVKCLKWQTRLIKSMRMKT